MRETLFVNKILSPALLYKKLRHFTILRAELPFFFAVQKISYYRFSLRRKN